jgi:hypothetical protein
MPRWPVEVHFSSHHGADGGQEGGIEEVERHHAQISELVDT